ncbi:hypothetical protein llap_12833 [Limosa lapponica baueri]|uniref:Uncharacterized protein n=1 Tax=Limosa lapponica baueri TaxID=1758121 RepID=A0A2I0TSS4_LIMLA|nr:hypothetical protein llap_12833 [Limosa lapponica baueri]
MVSEPGTLYGGYISLYTSQVPSIKSSLYFLQGFIACRATLARSGSSIATESRSDLAEQRVNLLWVMEEIKKIVWGLRTA